VSAELPPEAVEMLTDTNLGYLGTLNRDGTAQVTPLWVHVEEGRAVFNTAIGRLKERNMRRDPRITVAVADQRDNERYVMITGTAEMTEEGAAEHIEALSQKYKGRAFSGWKSGMRRVKVYLNADHVRVDV
jgi:PPOX class probable F420-dependent enzyme